MAAVQRSCRQACNFSRAGFTLSMRSSFDTARPAPVSVIAHSVVTACGTGCAALRDALINSRTGLQPNDVTLAPLATVIGRIGSADQDLPAALQAWSCRNNRLAWQGLQADGFADAVRQSITRFGPTRVGLAMGTSTSSIGETELAYRQVGSRDSDRPVVPLAQAGRPRVHTPHSLGLFVGHVLGIGGPSVTVSTACSSSAKVFAVAERWLRLGLVDAVVVGGVDSLCDSVLHGFNTLQLVSASPCRPFDVARDGINLGEAAGFALLTREPSDLRLLGCGESSDAFHMSSPHPAGVGVAQATAAALAKAGVQGADVDYLNLHGTASQKNDAIEAIVVDRFYGPGLHASATKGWTGHTLGAAGIVEAVICLEALRTGFMPGIANTRRLDPQCGPQIRIQADQREIRIAASNSFGFGGSNCVLIFGRDDA